MDSQNTSIINKLLRAWPRGTVGLQEWLNSFGVYRQLASRYCQSEWLRRIGSGAYQLMDDEVDWTGAIYAIQQQLHYQIHVGALTALEIQGYGHFLRLGKPNVIWLFRNSDEIRALPRWFKNNFANEHTVHYLRRDFLKNAKKLGLHEYPVKDFQIIISTPERAIFECMELAPDHLSLEHIKELMENMSTLRPNLVQQLLGACTSIQTKRLFMFFAEQCGHPWVSRLKLESIDFGSGKRVLGKGGRYYPKYQLSLPINIDEHEGNEVSETDEK